VARPLLKWSRSEVSRLSRLQDIMFRLRRIAISNKSQASLNLLCLLSVAAPAVSVSGFEIVLGIRSQIPKDDRASKSCQKLILSAFRHMTESDTAVKMLNIHQMKY
jgi:hypothetical protein